MQACPYDKVYLLSLHCPLVMLTLRCAGGGKGVKDGKDKKSKKKAGVEEEAEEETYYDAMKKDMGDRAARTKVHQLDHSLYFSTKPRLLCIIHTHHALHTRGLLSPNETVMMCTVSVLMISQHVLLEVKSMCDILKMISPGLSERAEHKSRRKSKSEGGCRHSDRQLS